MSESAGNDVLLAELADSFVKRYQQGERPSVEAYVAAHPELEDRIRELFPAMVVVEELMPDVSDPANSAVASDIGREPPVQLGDFRIIRELGRGGMGVVYEAEQSSLGRRVALKLMSHSRVHDEAAVRRFEREARAAARLQHANIVPVYEVGVEGEVRYFAMQFIQGQGLDAVIRELRGLRREGSDVALLQENSAVSLAISLMSGTTLLRQDEADPIAPAALPGPIQPDRKKGSTGRITLDDTNSHSILPTASGKSERGGSRRYFDSVADIGVQVARALAYAHDAGVLHRDVKPSNLILDHRANVWVADFGLAKMEDGDLTRTGDVVGTLSYLAPECFRGEFDARSDVYALGVTLYELATMRPAYSGSDRLDVVRKITQTDPVRPRHIDSSVPRDLETIILKSAAREPASRYQSAAELAADLQRFVDDEPIHARRESTMERSWRWIRRNPRVAALGTIIVILTMGLLAAARGLPRDDDPVGPLLKPAVPAAKKPQQARPEILRGDEARHGGDHLTALLWYVKALQTESPNVVNDRMRIAATMKQTPRLRRLHAIEVPAMYRTVFDPTGSRVALYRSRYHPPVDVVESEPGPQLRNVHNGQPIAQLADHTDTLTQCVFTADGRLMAYVVNQSSLRIVAATDGSAIGKPLEFSKISSLVFSPQGRWLIARGADFVAAVDTRTATVAMQESGRFYYPQLYTEDERYLVLRVYQERPGLSFRGKLDQVYVWDLPAKEEVCRLNCGRALAGCELIIRNDGMMLALADGRNRVWLASTDGEVKREWEQTHGRTLRLLADGKTLFEGRFNGAFYLHDLDAPDAPPRRFEAGSGDFHRVVISADGRRVTVIGIRAARAFACDTQTGKLVWRIRATKGAVSIRPSYHKQRALVQTNPTELQIIDLTMGTQSAWKLEHDAPLTTAVFSPSGNRIASGAEDGTVKVWDSRTGQLLSSWLRGPRPIVHVAFDKQDENQVITRDDHGWVRVWRLSAESVATWTPPGSQITLSADGRLVASARRGVVQVHDVRTQQVVATMECAKSVSKLRFSADATRLLAATVGQTVHLGRRLGDTYQVDLKIPHDARLTAVAFQPDGRRVATAAGGRVFVWDAENGDLVAGPFDGGKFVDGLSFSQDARLLHASTVRSRVTMPAKGGMVWDLQTGQPVFRMGAVPQPTDSVILSRMSPDGSWVVTSRRPLGPAPPLAKLYGVGNSQSELLAWEQERAVMYAEFDPASQLIVAAAKDFTARIWHVGSQLAITPPLAHDSMVTCAGFSFNSKRLVTGTANGGLAVWDVKRGEQIASFQLGGPIERCLFEANGTTIVAQTDRDAIARISLDSEARGTQTLTSIAQCLSGHRIDQTGGVVAADPVKLREVWQTHLQR